MGSLVKKSEGSKSEGFEGLEDGPGCGGDRGATEGSRAEDRLDVIDHSDSDV